MFERASTTKALIHLLKGVNGEIEYGVIEAAVGLQLARLRGPLNSARRALERDHKVVFATIRGFGLRRLSDGEKVKSTEAIKQRIRKASRRGLRRLDAVDNPALMLPSEQASATINRVLFEAIQAQTTAVNDRVKAAPSPTPDLTVLTRPQG